MFNVSDIVVCTKSDDSIAPCTGCVGKVTYSDDIYFAFDVMVDCRCETYGEGSKMGSHCEGFYDTEEWVKPVIFLHKLGKFYV